jgi:hypothetical protein
MGYTFIIEPKNMNVFDNETEQMDKCKEWGLLSEKASKIKNYYYKGNGINIACSIIGYIDDLTAVIEFDNKQQHCIHPSYLKEMQASSFSQRLSSGVEVEGTSPSVTVEPTIEQTAKKKDDVDSKDKPTPTEKSTKTTKSSKIELPVDKVKMSAIVQEFTTVPNHFADEDDEVVIYEAVMLVDTETEIGVAWSSHSATVKKVGLEVGDRITFEAKIAKKKLTKHPVPYKINNPSKMQKSTP